MRLRTCGLIVSGLFLSLVLGACGSGGDDGRFAYDLSLVGLPDSTTQRGHYEGWAVVNGFARSTGKFVVDGTGPNAAIMNPRRTKTYGTASMARFGPSNTEIGEAFPFLVDATHCFITVEPEGDVNLIPSCQVILAGPFVGGAAMLSSVGTPVGPFFPCAVDDGAGGGILGITGLASATGTFQMRTPTDDLSNPTPNDFAGVWFVDDDGVGGIQEGLVVPELPRNFQYEGWAEVDGVMRSLGRFRVANDKDSDVGTALQRGDDGPGPDFPGQDFVQPFVPAEPFDPPVLDLATGLVFPTGDYRAIITVEPEPDTSLEPLGITILSALLEPDLVNASGQSTGLLTLTLAPSFPEGDALTGGLALSLAALDLPALSTVADDRRGHYEVWAVLAGVETSIDRFVIVGTDVFSLSSQQVIGTTASVTFDATTTGNPAFPDTTGATEVFITLECEGDADGVPSERTILQGFVGAGVAPLTTLGDIGQGGRGLADFSISLGTVRLTTPTNNDLGGPPDDQNGILFEGLFLPFLPPGWRYEAWVEELATGRMYSTGRFRFEVGSDESDGASQSRDDGAKPPFPGEDFLFAVPTEMLVPAGAGSITRVMVSVEPTPDSSADPFFPMLDAPVPPGAVVGGVGGVSVPMNNVFPTPQTLLGLAVIDD